MLHRRDAMIRLGTAGLGALALPNLLRAERTSAKAQPAGRAKSCILLYLWGGPPQQDMWDLKPDAPEGIRSQFEPIDTVTPGIRINRRVALGVAQSPAHVRVDGEVERLDEHLAVAGYPRGCLDQLEVGYLRHADGAGSERELAIRDFLHGSGFLHT